MEQDSPPNWAVPPNPYSQQALQAIAVPSTSYHPHQQSTPQPPSTPPVQHPQQHPQQHQHHNPYQTQHQHPQPQQSSTPPPPSKQQPKQQTTSYPGSPSPIHPGGRPVPAIVSGDVDSAGKMKSLMPQPIGGLRIRAQDEEAEDGRVRNKEAEKKIQDDWFCKQIWARASEFTKYSQARILLGTWNVNAKGKDENLDSWLCADWNPDDPHAPDLIAVGLQEMVDLNAVNVSFDNKASQRSQHWVDRVRHTLNSRPCKDPEQNSYTLLATKYLVGLLSCVFVRNRHRHRVTHVHASTAAVGVMGMMGNKGGVSIRLQFYDSTICIVNSHLAAHRENVAGRNADFRNVFQKTQFRIGSDAVSDLVRNGALTQWTDGGSSIGVADHDLTFWIGDLNYRVDECVSTEDVLDMAKAGRLEELRKHDQLLAERRAGRVFPGFHEGRLTFRPTYKYQPGTDVYDERPDKKIRAPAWCDRILWRAQVANHVKQVNYCCSPLNVSDHKPVMSTLVITVKDVIESQREKVHRDVNKKLDTFDNKKLPMVGLDTTSLDFGEVRYGQKITLPIKVTNTGKVVAQFRFIPKLNEKNLCQPWMTISPAYGMLIPDEKEETINFTITVDNVMANALNSGREVLEDIIILRLENGRDYFITVTGNYARSCFGMTVDKLVLYSDPVRDVPLDPIRCVEKYGDDPTAKFCIPKELFRLVDAIYQKGLDSPDLFSTAGHAQEMDEIRECLDTGAPFPERSKIHSFAEVLVAFLSNLDQTIVPQRLLPTLEIDEQNLQFYTRKFLDELPPIHYNVFVYVTSFFRECLVRQQAYDLMPAKLARICCNCLVEGSQGTGEEGTKSSQRRRGMEDIMMHFLETSSI